MNMETQRKDIHIEGFGRNGTVNNNGFQSFGINDRIVEIRSAA